MMMGVISFLVSFHPVFLYCRKKDFHDFHGISISIGKSITREQATFIFFLIID